MDWSNYEDRVRQVASFIWGKPCRPETIEGVRFDGVVRLDDGRWVLIEATVDHTLDKIRTDIAKLSSVRLALFGKNIFPLCYIVKHVEPTESMVALGEANKVAVLSVRKFEEQFFDFRSYVYARTEKPFGSAVNPDTGRAVRNPYVPVSYHSDTLGDVDVASLAGHLRHGARILMQGQYGTGKSRCLQELFPILAAETGGQPYPMPIAINLREQWGMRSAQEIIRRHFADLGMPSAADNVIRALGSGAFCFLLDGFDELGAQVWSEDPKKIRQIRRQSTEGVRHLLKLSSGPVFISGRQHYFNNDAEAYEALGLEYKNTIAVRSKEEFTSEEMSRFLASIDVETDIPFWLPKRPLVWQVLSELPSAVLQDLLVTEVGEARFWRYFIETVCSREAIIRSGLDAQTVRAILTRLATLTRRRSGDVGPITSAEINGAFEDEVGEPPVDESALILHRLPGLGRIGADSSDRQFVDTYVLDGLRAEHVTRCVRDRSLGERVADALWLNPLRDFGLRLAGADLIDEIGVKGSVGFATIAAQRGNGTLAADIVGALLVSAEDDDTIEFNVDIHDAYASTLDLTRAITNKLKYSDTVFDAVILPDRPLVGVELRGCVADRVFGVTSAAGLPADWTLDVSRFDSVATNPAVRAAGLSPAQQILVTTVRRTFFQRGAARKENALFRGLHQVDPGGITDQVVKALIAEGLLERVSGQDGPCYRPIRKHTRRMRTMLAELKVSADPLWAKVSAL